MRHIHRDRWFTITHGDMWHGNVLLGHTSTLLIDWSNWSAGYPPFDLTYLICLASNSQNINARETILIERYLSILTQNVRFFFDESVFTSAYHAVAKTSVALLPVWLWKDGQQTWKNIYKPLLALL
jgi:thiamine kinase-like enzyme